MILRKLELENFRAFPSRTFEFSERVTVIAGVNGLGKSSILDGLSLLLSRLLPQVTPATVGYRYLNPRDVHQGQSDLKLGLTASFETVPVQFEIAYDTVEGKQRPTKLLPQVKREIRRIYGNPERSDDSAPIAVYYTTDRAAYRLPQRLLTGLAQNQQAAYHGALINRQIDFRDFMSRYRGWVDSVSKGEDQERKNQRTLAAINRAMSEFLPGFSDIRVEENPLRLLVSKQGCDFDLTQMSDGERSLFAMVIDLCRRLVLANPMLDDPLQGAGVVLIDEVELHLHPKWQREIIQKLRTTFPGLQFILTTHSPFVIQSLRSRELIVLDQDISLDYGNQSIEDIIEEVQGIDMPQRSQRYQNMMRAAEQYYTLLRQSVQDEDELARLKRNLDALAAPFSDDPAFQALLKQQRLLALGAGGD